MSFLEDCQFTTSFGLILVSTGAKNAGGPLSHRLFPLGNLHRIDVEFLGDSLNGFDALECLNCHADLKF